MKPSPFIQPLLPLLMVVAVIINATTDGNLLFALLPAVVVMAVWAVWRLPLRFTLLGLLFVTLVLDNPQDRPQQDKWQSLLYAPGRVLYLNLHNNTGINALRFSLLELLLAFLCVVALARWLRGAAVDGNPKEEAAQPLKQSLVAYCCALVFFVVWGLVRGGDAQQTLWQIRQLIWLPPLAFLAMRAFRTRTDLWRLGVVIVGAACIRAAEGMYYYFIICKPLNFKPEYVTTHGDSMLFATALMIAVLCVLERPGVFSLLVSGVIVPIMGLALVLNNRRLAFVCIFVSLITVALSIRRSVQVWIFRGILGTLPVMLLYVAVGWNSTSKIFAPITRLKSAADSKDTSNLTRDIENGNLIITINNSPLIGSGFGHEYIERVHAYDIQKLFPQYRYIAHNSVLWLWSQTGLVGFTLIWLPLIIGMFLALRTYHAARRTTARVVAMTTLTVIVCYAGQAYGDMGLQSWTATLIVSVWLGATGRLAAVTGAWPHRMAPARIWPSVGIDGSCVLNAVSPSNAPQVLS